MGKKSCSRGKGSRAVARRHAGLAAAAAEVEKEAGEREMSRPEEIEGSR